MAKEELLTGVGDLFGLYTPENLSQTYMTIPCNSEFSLQGESTPLRGQKFNGAGQLVTGASVAGTSEYTLTLTSEVINWDTLGFYLNQRPGTDASVEIPIYTTGTVPAASPYTITNADITASNASGVYIYIADGQDSGPRTTTASAPNAGETQVDGASSTLTFNAADAGKSVVYTVPTTYTNRETYGGARSATDDTYSGLTVWGVMYPAAIPIYFDNLTFESIPSIDTSGDVATLSVDFACNVSAGNDFPYKMWKPV